MTRRNQPRSSIVKSDSTLKEELDVMETSEPKEDMTEETPEVKPTPVRIEPKVDVKPTSPQLKREEPKEDLSYIDVKIDNFLDAKLKLESSKLGIVHQEFFNFIRGLLRTENYKEFAKKWNRFLLKSFNSRSKGFDESNILVGHASWTGSPLQFAIYRRILIAVIETANPETRNRVKKDLVLDLLVKGLTNVEKNNLINFYS